MLYAPVLMSAVKCTYCLFSPVFLSGIVVQFWLLYLASFMSSIFTFLNAIHFLDTVIVAFNARASSGVFVFIVNVRYTAGDGAILAFVLFIISLRFLIGFFAVMFSSESPFFQQVMLVSCFSKSSFHLAFIIVNLDILCAR